MPELHDLRVISKCPKGLLDLLYIFLRAVEPGWILKQESAKLSCVRQRLEARTYFIHIILRDFLPGFAKIFAPELFRMREFLPQLYSEGEVGWSLGRPGSSSLPRRRVGKRSS